MPEFTSPPNLRWSTHTHSSLKDSEPADKPAPSVPMSQEHAEAKRRIDGLVEREERTGYISETGVLKALAALLRYTEAVEGQKP